MSYGSATENKELLGALQLLDDPGKPEGKVFCLSEAMQGVLNGNDWPHAIHTVLYDQSGSSLNVNWYDRAYYTFVQRENQFVVLPYIEVGLPASPPIFVAYEYEVARNLLATEPGKDSLRNINFKSIVNRQIPYQVTTPDGGVKECSYCFGFMRNFFDYPWINKGNALSYRHQLFFVFKPKSMHIYQYRFANLVKEANTSFTMDCLMATGKTALASARSGTAAAAAELISGYMTSMMIAARNGDNVLKADCCTSFHNLVTMASNQGNSLGATDASMDKIKEDLKDLGFDAADGYQTDILRYVTDRGMLEICVMRLEWVDQGIRENSEFLTQAITKLGLGTLTESISHIPGFSTLCKMSLTQLSKGYGHYLREIGFDGIGSPVIMLPPTVQSQAPAGGSATPGVSVVPQTQAFKQYFTELVQVPKQIQASGGSITFPSQFLAFNVTIQIPPGLPGDPLIISVPLSKDIQLAPQPRVANAAAQRSIDLPLDQDDGNNTRKRIEDLEYTMGDMVSAISSIEESMAQHMVRTHERTENIWS